MKASIRKNIVGWVALVGLMIGSSAQAATSAALLAGYGFADGYKLGVGARAGTTVMPMIYAGGHFTYHFGQTTEALGTQVSNSLWLAQGEAGYELDLEGLVARPYLGLGLAGVSGSVTSGGTRVSSTSTEFALSPGLVVLHNLNPEWFVGGDARYNIISNANSFAILGTVGMNF